MVQDLFFTGSPPFSKNDAQQVLTTWKERILPLLEGKKPVKLVIKDVIAKTKPNSEPTACIQKEIAVLGELRCDVSSLCHEIERISLVLETLESYKIMQALALKLVE